MPRSTSRKPNRPPLRTLVSSFTVAVSALGVLSPRVVDAATVLLVDDLVRDPDDPSSAMRQLGTRSQSAETTGQACAGLASRTRFRPPRLAMYSAVSAAASNSSAVISRSLP